MVSCFFFGHALLQWYKMYIKWTHLKRGLVPFSNSSGADKIVHQGLLFLNYQLCKQITMDQWMEVCVCVCVEVGGGNLPVRMRRLVFSHKNPFLAMCHLSIYLSIYLSIQLDAPSDWRPGGRGFNPRRGRQHSFVEIDHEIFSTVILSLPLIQEGQLSVSGERMCTILVNRLED